jgi:hypothetical protein
MNRYKPGPSAGAGHNAGSDVRRRRSRLGNIGIPSKHLVQKAPVPKQQQRVKKSSSCEHPNFHATVFA